VGIGGIGMSGIAEILHAMGYEVQGSDLKDNAMTQRLSEKGVKIFTGHEGAHVAGVDVVVRSSAVKNDNPEVVAARDAMIPVIPRAEMLAEIMRLKWSVAVAGTHGKTTTTSLIAQILKTAEVDPTVINGGIINSYGTNAHLGSGEWMVVETDESDGSFTRLRQTVGVVTNIDPEHMDHYGDFDTLKKAFETFIRNTPFYGFNVVCSDHPVVQAMIPKVSDKKIITYGFNPQADVRCLEYTQKSDRLEFDVVLTNRKTGEETALTGIELPMIGQHNVLNALAAIGVAWQMRIPAASIKLALKTFGGVKRRFTCTGEVNGIRIYDDYAHHPTEIAATLKAARSACQSTKEGRVVAVVQPHRYSRLADLFAEFCTCFQDADVVLVAPVYAAGESPIEGAEHTDLASGLKQHGHKAAYVLEGPDALASAVAGHAKAGDFVVCMGAGSISTWAQELPSELEKELEKELKGVKSADRQTASS